MKFTVEKEYNGYTARDYLKKVLGISAAGLNALKKKENGILLNGVRVTVRAILSHGDIITLELEDSPENENPLISPLFRDIDILYEDDSVLAVNKPSGMPTHPSHGHLDDTLSNALCAVYRERNQPFVFRPVNRLDRDTSGIVLIAKSRYYANLLREGFASGVADKRYVTLLPDAPIPPSGRIEGYIKRLPGSIMQRYLSNGGDESEYSLTRYKLIEKRSGSAAVIVSPVTGKTHQIRVHFASKGLPILGDGLYGEENFPRLALHAYYLCFNSPKNGKTEVFAPIPKEFEINENLLER